MDRIQFLQSIKNIELSDIIASFFDQYMLIYNLIDKVNDIEVISKNENAISFQLNYTDPQDIQRLKEKLSSTSSLVIYESMYGISSITPTDSSIIISISK